MRRYARITASLFIATTNLQCISVGTSPTFDTYIAPRETIDFRAMRLALVPLSMPPDIEDPEPVVSMFDSLIESSLVAHGFDIVPSAEYRAIWNRLNEEAGGFFNPFTGIRDEPKYAAGVTQLYKEMHQRFSPDGFLFPEIWVVEAPLIGDQARWDGTSERVWPTPSGLPTVYALTLAVVIQDSAGTELFVNGRGLDVMETYDLDANEMVMLPREELFRDPRRYAEAVDLVLAPLFTR